MSEPLNSFSARVLALWRQGLDTYEIGLRLQIDEYIVYRALWRAPPVARPVELPCDVERSPA